MRTIQGHSPGDRIRRLTGLGMRQGRDSRRGPVTTGRHHVLGVRWKREQSGADSKGLAIRALNKACRSPGDALLQGLAAVT